MTKGGIIMSNKLKVFIIVIFILLVIGLFFIIWNIRKVQKAHSLKITEGIEVVPTMSDKITGDSSWCGTFQLVWNDMRNEVVKQDIIFNPQEEIVKNLNKEEFNEDMISEEYYYKTYGLKTLELKEEIEKRNT